MKTCCTYTCVDAGTEHCPCYLAVTGDCLVCSRLQGKETCDCDWQGVCIYNEFIQGQKQINQPRREHAAAILKKEKYLDDLTVFVLEVGKGFALRASRTGSYVFLRHPEDVGYYDAPISVLKADEKQGTIHVAVKEIAPKTRRLMEAKEHLLVRGVYRGGIQGVRYLQPAYLKGKSLLFITKGAGAAPALLAAEQLSKHSGIQVDWVADTEKISARLLADYGVSLLPEEKEPQGREVLAVQDGRMAGQTDLQAKELSLSSPRGRSWLRRMLRQGGYDVVAIMASDYFVEILSAMIREELPQAKVAYSNNVHLCCGEGVCGACTQTDAQGNTFRMCKCQREEMEE